jgi:hypothetical protein
VFKMQFLINLAFGLDGHNDALRPGRGGFRTGGYSF